MLTGAFERPLSRILGLRAFETPPGSSEQRLSRILAFGPPQRDSSERPLSRILIPILDFETPPEAHPSDPCRGYWPSRLPFAGWSHL